MRLLVVGAGALGSVFGCILRDKGHAVGILEPTSRLEDIRSLGLKITGLFGEHYCRDFALYSSPDDIPPGYYDLFLLTVKSFDTAEAIQQISHAIRENAIIISLQNGLGNYEIIRDNVGDNRALAGRVIFGSQMFNRAHAEVTVYAEPVMLGSPSGAISEEVIGSIAKDFSDAGIPTQATNEIEKYIWSKLLYNCSLNPLSGILNVPYGKLLEIESTKKMMRDIVREIFAVADAKGIKLFWSNADEYVDLLFGKLIPDTATHYASMAQDLQNHRRTEIESLNGAVVKQGEALGVSCPVNDMLTGLVKAIETVSQT